jgi:hypothetical protein
MLYYKEEAYTATDRHAGWCGGWRREPPGYPIRRIYFAVESLRVIFPEACFE